MGLRMFGRFSAYLVIVTALVFPSFKDAEAKAHTLGLGIILGEPTGISVKHWLSPKTAIDGGIGFAFGRESGFHLHADYLWHKMNLFRINEAPFHFYYGPGVRIKTESKFRVGVRGATGLAYHFKKQRIDIFLEIVPILDVSPSVEISFNGAIGGRYYFSL